MGRLFVELVTGPRVYCCALCNISLASGTQLVSTTFHSRNGKAYLFNSVANVTCGKREERDMTTGKHEVADVYCSQCFMLLGWKYDFAHDTSQKYKEGKYVLERPKLVVSDGAATAAAYSMCPIEILSGTHDSDSEEVFV